MFVIFRMLWKRKCFSSFNCFFFSSRKIVFMPSSIVESFLYFSFSLRANSRQPKRVTCCHCSPQANEFICLWFVSSASNWINNNYWIINSNQLFWKFIHLPLWNNNNLRDTQVNLSHLLNLFPSWSVHFVTLAILIFLSRMSFASFQWLKKKLF